MENVQVTPMVVGNVKLGSEGVSIVIPWTSTEDTNAYYASVAPSDEDIKKVHECIYDFVEGRRQHCVKELQSNICNAKVVTPNAIVWDGGCFSPGALRAMEDILINRPHISEMTAVELTQCVRALHFNNAKNYWGNIKARAFNALTEELWHRCCETPAVSQENE